MLASAALAPCWHRGFFVLPTVRKYSLAHFALDSPEQCCGVCLPTLAAEDPAPCTFASLPVVSSGAARRAAQSRDLLSTISCLLLSEGPSAPARCARLRSTTAETSQTSETSGRGNLGNLANLPA